MPPGTAKHGKRGCCLSGWPASYELVMKENCYGSWLHNQLPDPSTSTTPPLGQAKPPWPACWAAPPPPPPRPPLPPFPPPLPPAAAPRACRPRPPPRSHCLSCCCWSCCCCCCWSCSSCSSCLTRHSQQPPARLQKAGAPHGLGLGPARPPRAALQTTPTRERSTKSTLLKPPRLEHPPQDSTQRRPLRSLRPPPRRTAQPPSPAPPAIRARSGRRSRSTRSHLALILGRPFLVCRQAAGKVEVLQAASRAGALSQAHRAWQRCANLRLMQAPLTALCAGPAPAFLPLP